MKRMVDADPEVRERFKEECKVWATKATDLDSIYKKYNDTSLSHGEAQSAHKLVTEAGEVKDHFQVVTGAELKSIKA